uniref:Uncharacterized protein LOC103452853 n=1 Tax=Rhizophora mucronata TaxID=61149 RepID=A0A2P2PBV1_RHIMU
MVVVTNWVERNKLCISMIRFLQAMHSDLTIQCTCLYIIIEIDYNLCESACGFFVCCLVDN